MEGMMHAFFQHIPMHFSVAIPTWRTLPSEFALSSVQILLNPYQAWLAPELGVFLPSPFLLVLERMIMLASCKPSVLA